MQSVIVIVSPAFLCKLSVFSAASYEKIYLIDFWLIEKTISTSLSQSCSSLKELRLRPCSTKYVVSFWSKNVPKALDRGTFWYSLSYLSLSTTRALKKWCAMRTTISMNVPRQKFPPPGTPSMFLALCSAFARIASKLSQSKRVSWFFPASFLKKCSIYYLCFKDQFAERCCLFLWSFFSVLKRMNILWWKFLLKHEIFCYSTS